MSNVVPFSKRPEDEFLRFILLEAAHAAGGELSLEDERLTPYLPGLRVAIKAIDNTPFAIALPENYSSDFIKALNAYKADYFRKLSLNALYESKILKCGK